MCFQAETLRQLAGTPMSADVQARCSSRPRSASLYPDSASVPSPESVLAFLKANGIDYIYADAVHPNTLCPTRSRSRRMARRRCFASLET